MPANGAPICYACLDTDVRTPEVRLSYRQTAQAFIVGFTGRASHFIYPLENCGVLQIELKQLITQLHDWATRICLQDSGQIAINLLSGGADILLLPDDTLADKF